MNIRVLLISSIIDSASSRPDAELAFGLRRLDIEVDVMIPEWSAYKVPFEDAGIRVISYLSPKKYSCEAIKLIRKEIMQRKYHIIHLFNTRAIVNGSFAAIGLPVKVIAYRGAAGLHWYDPTAWLAHLNPRVDKIICNSRYVQQNVRKQLFCKDRTVMIHKGMDISWFREVIPITRKELNIPENAIVIGCIANVRKVKGVPYLVKATGYLNPELPVHILLVGSGMESGPVHELIKASPLREHIHILGFRKDVYNIIAACNIYIQPSLSESLSRSVMEAMSLGVPCIVSDAGGLTELVENNISGLIVKKANELELAKAIQLLTNDTEMQKEFAAKGRRRMKEIFSVENMVRNTGNLYHQLIS